MAENYDVSVGSQLVIDATLRDGDGNPLSGYTGSEALSTVVWPGANRAVAFTPLTIWTTPAVGLIAITITGAETATLSPGRYDLLTRVADGAEWDDGYFATLTVTGFAGTGVAPKEYVTYADLLQFGRSWLKELQTDDDQAGFAQEVGRASDWID